MGASPYIGMFGLSVFSIREVMLEVFGISWLLMMGSIVCRLLLSHRLALVGMLGSLTVGVVLMVGPWAFLVGYLPLLLLTVGLCCGVVGGWQLRGTGRPLHWVSTGAYWWWHPFREDPRHGWDA